MVQSVLGSLILGYRPLWNRARKLAGVQLYARNDANTVVDGAHLLRTLQELWSTHSPPLLISAQTPELLCDLLDHAPRGAPWIEVRSSWLADSTIAARARAGHQRGLQLVWRGDVSDLPDADQARCFDNSLLTLQPQDAMRALQTAATPQQGMAAAQAVRPTSPVLAGQIYENVASRALMEHCLDQNQALALAGWPTEDVLHSVRHHNQQPSHAVIFKLMKAIDDEQSLETFEAIMGEDPLLAYRFMVYTNSAALGLRTGIDSLRRGLVMMGYSSLQRWLTDQLPHANTDANLQPIRQAMVVRARLMAQVLNAGVENDLRREIYLCGLLSNVDELLGEPLGSILRRLPLSERIYNAAVTGTGPYAIGLQLARALEGTDAQAIHKLVDAGEMQQEEVNRALLRVLAEMVVERPAP